METKGHSDVNLLCFPHTQPNILEGQFTSLCSRKWMKKQTLFPKDSEPLIGIFRINIGALKPSPPTAQPIPYLLCLPGGFQGQNGIRHGSQGEVGQMKQKKTTSNYLEDRPS